ncbi:MAG TPA: FAD-dependent oxidoreductase, partial [Sphaerochaetaceae bacterium]|nr:FAD-dependent oxidoreductase [Sphaerochaetaceae bacterium]
MKNTSKQTYDVCIVGAGLSGLTAAAYLSRAGYSVVLLEKQGHPGGLVNSFSVSGYTFDGGARSIENSGILKP